MPWYEPPNLMNGENARRRGMAMLRAAMLTVAAAISIVGSAAAQEFSAKNVNLVVGFPPAGGYDSIARIFARHFGKHLPGNPSVVVQNQPGAGSLTAANLLYNAAPKDGSHIAMFASSAALEPLMGNALAKFEADKFEWLGNLNRDTPACGAWKTSGVKTWDDITRRKTRFGASGPAAITAQHAFFLKNALGADIQVIMGLGGTGPIVLAMQRGEVDASCGMFISSVRGPFRNDFEQGNLIIFMQFGQKKEPFFKDAVSIFDVVKNDDDRKLAEFVFSQAEVTPVGDGARHAARHRRHDAGRLRQSGQGQGIPRRAGEGPDRRRSHERRGNGGGDQERDQLAARHHRALQERPLAAELSCLGKAPFS